MPFPEKCFSYLIINNPKSNVNKISCRKENGSTLAKKVFPHRGKASESISFSRISGSITIETALSVPLFLFAAMSLIWLLEMHSIQTTVRCGLQMAGKRAAVECSEFPYLSSDKMNRYIVESIGEDRLDQSMIAGGSGGIHCEKSYISMQSGVMKLKAEYKLKLPLPVFAIPSISCSEEMSMKAWTGYVKEGFTGNESEQTVYIAESGIVYHLDSHCTYLDPSIHSVPASQVESMRNESHGKYHPCEKCMKSGLQSGTVYITDYGDRYHSSLDCSGLKRRVYAVPISEAGGKRPCSKCGNL